MRALQVEAGQRFGRLVVIDPEARRQLPSVPCGRRAALCECDCGNQAIVAISHLLLEGGTVSCGCAQRERVAQVNYIHGFRGHPLYSTHEGMMRRCYYELHKRFHRYGGRGITVCDRWHSAQHFISDILRDLGPRPAGKTLDRIDPDGNYEPGNVRWATAKEQRANRSKAKAAPTGPDAGQETGP